MIDDVPLCCIGCNFLDSDSMDEYGPAFFFCNLGIILPTKKNTCKKRSGQQVDTEAILRDRAEYQKQAKDWRE